MQFDVYATNLFDLQPSFDGVAMKCLALSI